MGNVVAVILLCLSARLVSSAGETYNDLLSNPANSKELNGIATAAKACGVRCNPPTTEARIVGGNASTPHTWPWQCRLEYDLGGGYFYLCGGVVLSREFVVSAGHCAYHKVGSDFVKGNTMNFKVICGDYSRFKDERSRQTLRVLDIFVHEKYNPRSSSYGFDIALFRIRDTLEINDYVQPVCLHPHSPAAGTRCVVTGWGSMTVPKGGTSSVLREVTVAIVDHEKCSRDYGGTITDSMLCAGDEEHGGKDSCSGDSGGPLVCMADNGHYELHGIVSFGRGCALPHYPGVYTSASKFVDWIRTNHVPLVVNAPDQPDPSAVCTYGPFPPLNPPSTYFPPPPTDVTESTTPFRLPTAKPAPSASESHTLSAIFLTLSVLHCWLNM